MVLRIDCCTPPRACCSIRTQLIAVLDIDSDVLAEFDDVDKRELEALLARYF